MFTGIVEACVPITRFERRAEGARLVLPAPEPEWEVAQGDSVAVNGACLTVCGLEREGGELRLAFDLSSETLALTSFGAAEAGRRVNVERAMRLSDRLSGHLVSGHVDGLATLTEIEDTRDGGRRMTFEVDAGLERYLVPKGSVTLDGISLTVVAPRGRSFDVALIPLTLEVTNLGAAQAGQRLNVEADLVGKWIEKLALPTG